MKVLAMDEEELNLTIKKGESDKAESPGLKEETGENILGRIQLMWGVQ